MITIVVVASTLQQAERAAELAGIEGRRGQGWVWARTRSDMHGRRPTRAIIAEPDLNVRYTDEVAQMDAERLLTRICGLDGVEVERVTT